MGLDYYVSDVKKRIADAVKDQQVNFYYNYCLCILPFLGLIMRLVLACLESDK